MNRVTGDSYEVPRYDPAYAEKSTCVDPDEYKIVKGQGSTNEGVPRGIPTRFKDPMEDINSAWTPHSVPGIKSQPWKYNYMDGSCGIRNLDKNYDRLDPELPDLESSQSSTSNMYMYMYMYSTKFREYPDTRQLFEH